MRVDRSGRGFGHERRPRPPRRRDRRRAAQQALAEAADRVSQLIVLTDASVLDVAVARSQVRELCHRLFPDRIEVFDRIYEARWDRLWAQWRAPDAA